MAVDDAETIVIAMCDEEQKFYAGAAVKNSRAWRRWSVIGILAALLTTIASGLILEDDWNWIRLVPAALSAAISTYIATFSFRGDSLRQIETAETLRLEKIAFEARLSPYDKENRVSLFASTIMKIVRDEVRQTRAKATDPHITKYN